MDRLIRIEGKIKKEARSHGRKPEQTEQKKIEKQSCLLYTSEICENIRKKAGFFRMLTGIADNDGAQ